MPIPRQNSSEETYEVLLPTNSKQPSQDDCKHIRSYNFISQSNDVFTNLALEDWLYKNHDFDHKVKTVVNIILASPNML